LHIAAREGCEVLTNIKSRYISLLNIYRKVIKLNLTTVVQYLLDPTKLTTIATIGALDNLHLTPLHRAARFGNLECIRNLLDNGADKEAKDLEGLVPIHWAAQKGYFKTN
jgi:hypothetical protein